MSEERSEERRELTDLRQETNIRESEMCCFLYPLLLTSKGGRGRRKGEKTMTMRKKIRKCTNETKRIEKWCGGAAAVQLETIESEKEEAKEE